MVGWQKVIRFGIPFSGKEVLIGVLMDIEKDIKNRYGDIFYIASGVVE